MLLLADMGYKVVKEAIFLMGLSNGGSVIDEERNVSIEG